MLISTRGRYALRVLLDIASKEGDDFSSLKLIAQRQGISLKYLESIISQLQAAGIVYSHRGKNGGYKLTKSTDEILLIDVLLAAEGSLRPVQCPALDNRDCGNDNCPTKDLWVQLNNTIVNFFGDKTLSDLLKSDKINLECYAK
ncbi:MAG: Rrf2 family transcriptional regulator [Christensenellaceae bacterium]|nr:Rrf2 family transcriptional regulator [Christensenellaceae bacterium]